MARYIMLANYTELGIANIRKSPDRVKAARALAKNCGAELAEFYLTMGEYDLIAMVEAPSDDVAARFALALGSLGNVRTKTLKAFTEDEFQEIVRSLP